MERAGAPACGLSRLLLLACDRQLKTTTTTIITTTTTTAAAAMLLTPQAKVHSDNFLPSSAPLWPYFGQEYVIYMLFAYEKLQQIQAAMHLRFPCAACASACLPATVTKQFSTFTPLSSKSVCAHGPIRNGATRKKLTRWHLGRRGG